MRTTFDLSPFTRSTIGFDRMLRLLDSVASTGETPSYPPYNILRTGDDSYRISVAVAGFDESELEVETHNGQLTVKSLPEKPDTDEQVSYLHRGIARRAFELRFSLADYVEVTDATVENGLLNISLLRNVPEAKKPRRIAIGKVETGKSLPGGKQAA